MNCAIVDAYGVGRYLAAALKRQGVGAVHVRSEFPDIHLAYRPEDFAVDLQHTGDLDRTARSLREHGVEMVVAGAESGVLLADALSDALGTPGNGMRRPLARRHKYEMVRAVREAGLATADSFASARAEEIVDWALARDRWPIVVKPVMSAGMDHVYFCHSEQDIRSAHAAVVQSRDRYARQNEVALAQEHLDGDEYFVNTVSRGGVHHVVEVWRYEKLLIDGTRSMVASERPVPLSDQAAAEVAAYAMSVLDALELQNGAGHTEVMLTARGPVLVECGARLGGAHVPEVVARCIGTDQVECLAIAIARPSEVIEGRLPGYTIRTAVRHLSLIMPGPGVVPQDDERWAQLRQLRSFSRMVLTQAAGKRIDRTVDLATSPGYVYLCSDDARQVEEDYRTIRKLEEGGLYR